jgi:hypothetical protein
VNHHGGRTKTEEGRMSEDDVAYRIGKLELRRGDVLVIKVASEITAEHASRMRDEFKKHVGAEKMIVLGPGIDLAVLTKSELQQRLGE